MVLKKYKYEKELKKSERKFKNIIKYLPVAATINDIDFNTLEINEQFSKLFGYTEDKIPEIKLFLQSAFSPANIVESDKKENKEDPFSNTLHSFYNQRDTFIKCFDGTYK